MVEVEEEEEEEEEEEDITGISDIASGTIKLFPNPASIELLLESDFAIESIVILDISGRVVRTAGGANSLNVSDLKSGIYLANVTSETGQEYLIKWMKK
ncbi:T9SS type A sorting domain-containing protein [Salibacteraceae bacterium]|nr:T9SS type A sorting domain-containing protein [Salibacteraceae bacterium]